MDVTQFEDVRYRTRLVTLILNAALAGAGAYGVYILPRRGALEWQLLALDALLCAVLLPLLVVAHRRGNFRLSERIGVFIVVSGSLIVAQRLYFAFHGPIMEMPTASIFRPICAFVPFVYLAAMAMLRSDLALRMCWAYWVVVAAIVFSGLERHSALRWNDDGAMLQLWLMVGNPLFILLLHALPRYEHWLDRSRRELDSMRERAELSDRLVENEHRFKMVVESLQVGIWDQHRGAGKTRHWWSPKFYELLGYTPEELPPSSTNIRALTRPQDAERVIPRFAGQLRCEGRATLDVQLRTRDRGDRWFNVSARAEKNDKGEIIHVSGSLADIHDRRCAEEALVAAQDNLRQLAYRDAVTGLANRRAFDEALEREFRQAHRDAKPLSLLMIDIDYFKPFNDRYGHLTGDECLRLLADTISECARRPSDLAARLGGDELALLLPDTTEAGALQVGQSIHASVRAALIPHADSPLRRVTLSIGVATERGGGTSEALIERADLALYEVKRRGRDAVLSDTASAATA